MYNKIKCNFIDETCPCEYVVSRDERFQYDYIDVEIFIGEGLENIEARAWCQTYGAEWKLPEVIGEGNTGYHNGWYWTRLRYSDFAKCASDDHFIEVRVYANGEQIGGSGGWLYIYHEGIGGDLSTNPVIVTKMQDVSILNSYRVVGIGSSGGSGGGGGGGGTTYTAGNGIDISDSNEIKAKIDGSTIQFNSNGEMVAHTESGLTIENAVVIKQSDSAYILHNFTEIDYIAGNKIGYAGQSNPIILQGHICYARYQNAPNGVAIAEKSGVTDESLIPDVPLYTNFNCGDYAYYGSTKIKQIDLIQTSYDARYDSTNYVIMVIQEDGSEAATTTLTFTNYNNYTPIGICFCYESIHKPTDIYPYGYVFGRFWKRYKGYGTKYYFTYTNSFNIGFSSEAEYNAAIGLTYEPNTLKMVIDTQEVTG